MDPIDLLASPVLRVRVGTSIRVTTLPDLLALLGSDQVEGFVGAQAHQEHAFYAFLVQVAALALQRAGKAEPTQSAEFWHAELIGLSGGSRSAWTLVEPDLTKPAFLQPPVLDGTLADFKNELATPDALDILVTAKNHDVKSARMVAATPDQWVYALLTLQTMGGFSGRGNYGVARMNGGFGNRPLVAFAPSLRKGQRFLIDVAALVREHDATAVDYGYSLRGGAALLWLTPWNGLPPAQSTTELDPWFVEVCRRVRLTTQAGGIQARMRPTTAGRVAAGDRNGKMGDPWTPIDKKAEKALTIGGSGFNYRVVQQLLLSGDYQPALCMHASLDAPLLLLSALVRGQGTTEGFHERVLPIPPNASRRLNDDRTRLAEDSKGRIDDVALVRNKVLRPAIRALLDAGASGGRLDDRPDRWVDAFERRVDSAFFILLWGGPEGLGEPDAGWLAFLKGAAQAELESAIGGAPLPTVRRAKAIASAERVFHGGFYNQFKTRLPERGANG
ncbi:MAG: type I-E CRISPR-associated protein Cse1/CasA [Pseudomonadota bacterium]|nr:type I-E CRISPR-associated protein Cse1/CasA [Pseudomonadota bacterium]